MNSIPAQHPLAQSYTWATLLFHYILQYSGESSVMPRIDIVKGVLDIPNGLANPKTPPFIIDADNMAFFIDSLMAHFFCMNTTMLPEEDAMSL